MGQFDNITEKLLGANGLFDTAEATLNHALAIQPHNTKLLWRLAEVQRNKGDFDAALEMYRRLIALQPQHQQAVYLEAVLSGKELSAETPTEGQFPAPFVHIKDFLSQAECDRLMAFVMANEDRFGQTKVGDGKFDPEIRTSWRLKTKELEEVRPWFLKRIQSAISKVLPRLSITPFCISRIELQLTVHLSGGFYKTHRDNSELRHRSRKISYVYYFHRQPKPFSGGDLLLYNTDLQTGEGSTSFTRIQPIDNSIIFFPSGYYHQITPVHYDTNDFGDARFTLNGWIHAENEEVSESA